MDMINIIFILLFIYVLHSGYQKIKKIHQNELKGPYPMPILGNLHQLGKYGLPHHTLTEFHKIYGSIYRVYFGDVYTVVINDPELIREICVDHHETIGRFRPETPSFRHAQNGNGISTSNEQWEKNREIVQNALKRGSTTKQIYQLLEVQVNELIKSMNKFEETNEPFEIHLYAHRYTLATMYKFIFNEDVEYDIDINQSKVAKLNQPLAQIFKDLSSGKLGDFINILAPFYYYYLKFTEKNIGEIKDYMKEKYYQHLSTIDQDTSRDFLDILIKEFGNDKMDAIIGIIFDLFLAGSDTAAASIEWFTLRMCNNQDIQEKAFREIKSVVGDRNVVKLSDRPSTPFLNAVIKESSRTSPVGPFGLPKSASSNVLLGNGKYFIPAKSQILFNYRGLALNENYFEDPLQFNPLRFFNKSNDAYIPFGVGARNCVGQNLASDELYLAFSNMLLNFKLTSLDGSPIDDTEIFGLTLKPNKFKINLKKR